MSSVPVILLTGGYEESDQLRGFALGADGYLVKPFGYLELLARIESVLRRARLPSRTLPAFKSGDLVVDFDERHLRLGGETVPLTTPEFKLLYALVRNRDRVVHTQALIEFIWGLHGTANSDHLKALVNRLRNKMGTASDGTSYIENERGMGYRFLMTRTAVSGMLRGSSDWPARSRITAKADDRVEQIVLSRR